MTYFFLFLYVQESSGVRICRIEVSVKGNTLSLFHKIFLCSFLHCSDLLVLGGLFDGSLLTDDLFQPLQPDVLSAQVAHACLAAMEQGQGIDVLQLCVANALVHYQIQQLISSVVQHLIVLPGEEKRNRKQGVRNKKKVNNTS